MVDYIAIHSQYFSTTNKHYDDYTQTNLNLYYLLIEILHHDL